jgi:hypothetical protein
VFPLSCELDFCILFSGMSAFEELPCGGVEYLHRRPAGRRWRRKRNPVPGGIAGHHFPGGYKYRDLALQIGGVSNLRQ